MPGINADEMKAQEVQSFTGSGGLANEFGGLTAAAGAFVQGVAGIHSHLKAKQEAKAEAASDARTAEFQTAQLSDSINQNQAQIDAVFSEDELAAFNKNTNLAERLKIAESKGVDRQLTEVRRMRALSDAIKKDPANRDEYVKIYQDVKTSNAFQAELTTADDAIQKAQAVELGRKAQLLIQNNQLNSTDGATPQKIEQLWQDSGLARLEGKINDSSSDITTRLTEKGLAVTPANIKAELNVYERENPEVIPGFVTTTITATLAKLKTDKSLDQGARDTLVAEAKASAIAGLSKRSGLNGAEVSDRYSYLLEQFKSLDGYDPTKERAAAMESEIAFLSNATFLNLVKNKPDALGLKAIQDHYSNALRDAGIQIQTEGIVTSLIHSAVTQKAVGVDENAWLEQMGVDPEGTAKVVKNVLDTAAFVEQPTAIQAAALTSMSGILAVNYGGKGNRIIGQSLEALSSPNMIGGWRAAIEGTGDPEKVSFQLKRAGRNISSYMASSAVAVNSLDENAVWTTDEKTGTVSIKSADPRVTAHVTRLNQSIKAIAHMEGHQDYGKILREWDIQ